MTTVGALVDRVLRDWLEPGDDQPTRLTLTSTITANATTLVYNADLVGPEELEILAAGTMIEVDSEEMLVDDIDESTNTITIAKRAVNGTDAAAHTTGAFIYPNRVWRRRVIFDATCDAIVKLYPDLYRILTSDAISLASTSYTEVDDSIVDDMVAAKYFLGTATGTSIYEPYPVRLINPAPFVDSGKAIIVSDLISGATGYLIYKAKFPRPTTEATTLATAGVEDDWQQLVILDVVAYLIAARELDLATQERLSRQLEQQGYPAGTPSQVRDSLLRYRESMMRRAKDALRVANPVTVSMNGMAG